MFLACVSWWVLENFVMRDYKISKNGVVYKFLDLVFCCFICESKDVWEVVCPADVIVVCVWRWSKD